MQFDGNLVVYTYNGTSTTAVWSSQTASNGFVRSSHRFLALDAVYGKLNMYGGNGENLDMPSNLSQISISPTISNFSTLNLQYPFPPESAWKPNVSLDDYPYLPAEYYINQGSNLVTGDGKFNLSLGRDCKLQFLEIHTENKTSKQVIWEPVISNTSLVPSSCRLMLKDDGKLQILNNQMDTVYWSTSPIGNNTVSWVLKLLSDGGAELVVLDMFDSKNRLWSSIISTSNEKTSTAISWWPIVVGVLSGFFSLIVVGVAFWYFYARKRLLDPVDRAFQRKMKTAGFSQTLYTESRIKQATDNFGNKIGQGGFGDVFYGKLEDGQEIAAKVLSSTSCQSKQEFYNEIELLSTVHHKYLVSLLGYRCSHNQQILVYEYLGGGDLRQRLQGNDAKENPLTWKQRTSIILQVAEGLEYLHDKCCPSIIHRDVKSNNILLTNKLVAKVADFGLSKIRTLDQEEATHITTIVKGTPGYLDPEYHEKGVLTAKSDVYAYGIVLMEVLTGCNQMGIVHRVADAWVSENLETLPDPNLQGDFDTQEFAKLVELSLWCARIRNEERPFMRQVVQTLREIGVGPMDTSRPEISFPDERHFYNDVPGSEELTAKTDC
ncbi:probable LRR receptor-like serine/threonine-protein kinase At1g51880 isoform X3 [Physcomitrium patens]|uniref:Protein kinase domain-containing protein n=1 Tax=Physcomitrium patens TaxID=3218 RepID=A0A2K1KQ79_PHYPA|nr:cold-responsive protein kinase 1-like isoform X3 [Physcomitrium patens]PNR55911.1 hypothetical protein PHYPA_006808 [Physcomitrium patens]|eukprot:XP_024373082.1 cold-responsive protein kinase 1-like isoform X3 [Physcomitrella patens]